MADGEEPEKKRRRVEELLAEKIAVDGGCGDTGDWEGRWNHVKKFVEPSGPFTHPYFEPSTEFAYITQQDYCRVLHQAEMNIQKVEEEREILIVKEHQDLDGTGIRKGHIVIKILNNGQNFENIQLSKVVEFLRDNTHLSITVKNNLFDLVYQVLRVFKADQQNRHIMISKDTTANEVVIQAIWEFAITATHDQYSLCEVSVTPERVIKQRRLPDQFSKLANRMRLSGRYTLSHGFLSPP